MTMAQKIKRYEGNQYGRQIEKKEYCHKTWPQKVLAPACDKR